MINFRNCSPEVSQELNRIVAAVSRAAVGYRSAHQDTHYGKLTVFLGHEQYDMLLSLSPYDNYGVIGDTFMTQKVVRVMQDRYLAVAVTEDLIA